MPTPETTFSGRVAVVTGSTQGLGEAIARGLISERMITGLVICVRNSERCTRLAGDFTALGCRTEFVTADLANLHDCATVIETARREFNRIDYLVNSAATSERGSIEPAQVRPAGIWSKPAALPTRALAGRLAECRIAGHGAQMRGRKNRPARAVAEAAQGGFVLPADRGRPGPAGGPAPGSVEHLSSEGTCQLEEEIRLGLAP